MTFDEIMAQVIELLQVQGKASYRALKRRFEIDDDYVEDLKEEISYVHESVVEVDDRGFKWIGETEVTPVTPSQPDKPETQPVVEQTQSVQDTSSPVEPHTPAAERRQLTVMFCDLVGSTDLSGKLDPEDLREVVKAYQETAAEVVERYEGHIAQYLGDGLLIYFGFPVAHEDDAQRALYTGLGIPEAMTTLNTRLATDYGVKLDVRIGIHTGPVVVGEMGGGSRHENLALGETPNIAARLEGIAQPNTAVVSPITAQLVQRSFILEELGPHELKGVSEPMMLYTVTSPREAEHDDYETLLIGGFSALVGRDEEIGLLLRRWEQSKEGQGQVVLISGEAGLGKSSLVEGLRTHVYEEGYTRIAFRCSPYMANSDYQDLYRQSTHPVLGLSMTSCKIGSPTSAIWCLQLTAVCVTSD